MHEPVCQSSRAHCFWCETNPIPSNALDVLAQFNVLIGFWIRSVPSHCLAEYFGILDGMGVELICEATLYMAYIYSFSIYSTQVPSIYMSSHVCILHTLGF